MAESRANRTQENGIWRYIEQEDAEFVCMSEPEYSVEAVDDFIDSSKLPEDTILMLRGMRHDGLQAYLAKNIPLMEAHLRGLHMACRAAGMLDTAKIGARNRKSQSAKAKKPRAAKADNGESIHQIIKRLSIAPEYREEPALRLWPMFYGELDRLGLSPVLDESDRDPKKWCITYDHKDRDKPMTFGTFANRVTLHRQENHDSRATVMA